jgi:hypothetical protein
MFRTSLSRSSGAPKKRAAFLMHPARRGSPFALRLSRHFHGSGNLQPPDHRFPEKLAAWFGLYLIIAGIKIPVQPISFCID